MKLSLKESEEGKYRLRISENGRGCFGEFYQLTLHNMEELFVFLGDRIADIKGGVGKELGE